MLIERNSIQYMLKLTSLAVAIILFMMCSADKTVELKELHRKYMTASINHDIETLRAMMHEDIIWQLGPYTLKGKESGLGPHRYDAGTGAIFEYSNAVVRGDTVKFELLERNSILSANGMEDGARFYPRLIFKDGLVYQKEAWKASPDMKEMNRLAQPYREWRKQRHPEISARFFDSDGNFVFNRENGELNVQLALEWKQITQGQR